MKRIIKAASTQTTIRVIYCEGLATQEPVLGTVTVNGSDLKETLIRVADDYVALPYLHLDFDDPDSFTSEELIEAINYYNGSDVDMDYIFLLEVNGEALVDNTKPEEHY